jgi:hypothetical protein
MVIGSLFEKYTCTDQVELRSPRTSLVSDKFLQARAITSLSNSLNSLTFLKQELYHLQPLLFMILNRFSIFAP